MPGADPIAKILVDFDDFLRLKNSETKAKSFDEIKKKELNLVAEHSSDFPHSSTSTIQHGTGPASNKQHGKGPQQVQSHLPEQSNFNVHELISTVTSAVLKEIKSQHLKAEPSQHLKAEPSHDLKAEPSTVSNQIGKGDVLPEVPEEVDLPNDPPLSFGVTQRKSVLHDDIDDANLILSVPEKYQEKASKLLKLLNKDSLTFSYNSKGEVYIDQTSVPNSDMFIIFPELFERKQKSVPGLSEVATKIAFLGLGHLINCGITKGLKRQKSFKENPSVSSQIRNLKHWYYIGPL